MALSAFAAERRRRSTLPAAHLQLSIDISCPLGAQQQTRRPSLLLSIDGTESYIDRAPIVYTPAESKRFKRFYLYHVFT